MRRYPLRIAVALMVAAGVALVAAPSVADRQPASPNTAASPKSVRARYQKYEHAIPMRDGARLHTAVYAPRTCTEGGYPVMLQRTPYSVAPYGRETYRSSLGPSQRFQDDGFIFVYQDVRGRHMSEGLWEEVRPYVPASMRRDGDTNEATDTWDTIDWLLRHVPCHNGRVGMWGISYPGFYVSSGMIEAHPALRAVSPQGPVTDYYLNDDSFHNGAFLLAHNFGFYVEFPPRGPEPRLPRNTAPFDYGTPDAYAFYLGLGSLSDATRKHGLTDNHYWTMNLEHTTYDAFWQARSLWRHFRDVRPAVLTVGGWYDAENLWGALRTYRTLRDQSPATTSHLVMGPWTHGGWARGTGTRVGALDFGQDTAAHYRDRIEFPFFAATLKDRPEPPIPGASIFETGSNRWRTFDTWPPRDVEATRLFVDAGGVLTSAAPAEPGDDAFESDPARPVPLVSGLAEGMPSDYMAADQRFAAARDDVLVYVSAPLEADMTVLGAVEVDLHVSTSGTDADFVVKLIDVHPDGAASAMAGYQQMVRGEPFRGKFRESFETPVAFVPNQPARIAFTLGEVAHTFRRGHRVMLHVQGSWFPLIDRNPQTFTHIPDARPDQFVKATHRVHRGGARATSIVLPVAR